VPHCNREVQRRDRGIALAALEKYNDAIESFVKAIELDPANPDAWFRKGLALYSLSNYDDAIEAFNKTIETRTDYAPAFYHKGQSLFRIRM